MLRGLVLLLLLANLLLFAWLRSEPAWLQADRDPQRMTEQIGTQGVQVLLLRNGAKAAASAAGDGAASAAASGAANGLPAAGPAASAGVGPQAEAPALAAAAALACLESGPLTSADWSQLARRVADAGIPPSAVSAHDVAQRGRWLVYMGRFTDDALMNRKAEELRRMNLAFERLVTPPRLAPGLSLGNYDNPDAAETRLNELVRRGVRTARTVNLAPPGTARHMRLQVPDAAALGPLAKERFKRCAA